MFWRIFFGSYFVVVLVAMVTCGQAAKNRGAFICGGDTSGFNCLYQSNKDEFADVRVFFDKALPVWLKGGTLIRNGPGLFERGEQNVAHVFDGFAKLSSWKFTSQSSALFSTRFIRSDFYQDTMKKDHIAPYLLFSPPNPPFNLVQKGMSLMHGLDNMNINIFDFPDEDNRRDNPPKFAALTEYWNIYEISDTDLSTLDYITPRLRGGISLVHKNMLSSAHPLPEPGTSNRLTYLIRQATLPFIKNRLSLVRMTSISKRQLIAEWKIRETVPYMHSFSVTQTKAVIMTGPVVVSNACIISMGSPLPCMEWHDDMPSKLYIADLKTGRKKEITMSSSLFAIHHINAYDLNEDEIIMDVVSYDDTAVFDEMLMMDVIKNANKRNRAYQIPRVRRVHINMASKTAEVTDMSTLNPVSDSLDMPAINENFRSKKYCFVYGINNFAAGKRYTESAIIKKDMCNGGTVVGTLLIQSHYPVEPVFVPKPDSGSEDDGVLLVPILNGPDAVTYLAVVDAQTMEIISQANMPTYLPISFHGRFFRDLIED